jgi:hypothetical protein
LIDALKAEAIRFEVTMCLGQFTLAADPAVAAEAAKLLAEQGCSVSHVVPWSRLINTEDLVTSADAGKTLPDQAAKAQLAPDPQTAAVASSLIQALDDPDFTRWNEAASTLRWQSARIKEGIPRRHQRRVAHALLGGGSPS